jgi:hypothetical protein
MVSRLGEMLGWTLGWIGGFLWVAALALVLLLHGRVGEGAIGLSISIAAVVAIVTLAPWRHPTTPAWKLMLPLYLVEGIAVAWAVGCWHGSSGLEPSWWWLASAVPLLMPLATAGGRRWTDNE